MLIWCFIGSFWIEVSELHVIGWSIIYLASNPSTMFGCCSRRICRYYYGHDTLRECTLPILLYRCCFMVDQSFIGWLMDGLKCHLDIYSSFYLPVGATELSIFEDADNVMASHKDWKFCDISTVAPMGRAETTADIQVIFLLFYLVYWHVPEHKNIVVTFRQPSRPGKIWKYEFC